MRTGWLIVSLILVTIAMPALAQEIEGNLEIQSTPPMAAVYINGEYAGITPLSLTVDAGSYEIRIVKEGYYEFVKKVEVKANNTTYINAILAPVQPTSTPTGKFREGPVVRLRPVNDIVSKSEPGIIEFYFSNPAINDVELTAEVYISVPSGIHIETTGFALEEAAGTFHGLLKVPPGTGRTIYAYIYGEKVGDHIIHAEVKYYPGNNKDDYHPVSLTHVFKIVEPTTKEDIKKHIVKKETNKDNTVITILQQPINPMWIILIVIFLGGIAIIFAVRRKPPTIKIEEE